MFKQYFLLLSILVMIAQAGRPYQEDHQQAIHDLTAAGIDKKVAEELFQIESKTNHAVADANGDKVKIAKLMADYKEKRGKIFKKVSKDQLKTIKAFFA